MNHRRWALGASEQAVLRLFLREGMLPVLAGIVAGTAGAVARAAHGAPVRALCVG